VVLFGEFAPRDEVRLEDIGEGEEVWGGPEELTAPDCEGYARANEFFARV